MAGIYIHYPFCKQACHYCNFHFSTQLKQQDKMLKSMLAELELQSSFLKKPLESIYFGGGSPSLLSPKVIEQWLLKIDQLFEMQTPIEISLEINPDDASPTYLKTLKQVGVNRISLGIQSFQQKHLDVMNRLHNAAQAELALEHTAALFDNFSIDLIYGMPQSTLASWEEDIDRALQYKPMHLSAYALTEEPKTVLAHQVKTGEVILLEEELVKAQFDHLVQRLTQQGYNHYEVSNFGKPNYYAVNNSNYWKGKAYLGIGPGAHSFDGINTRSWNVSNNPLYMKQIQEGLLPQESETLSQKDLFNEYIMTGLRTQWGVSLHAIKKRFGPHFAAYLEEQVTPQLVLQNVFWDGDILKISQHARFLSDGIASDLFLL